MLRTGNKLAALLTLVGDAGKAGAAVLIARATLGPDAGQLAGFAAFAGHAYPVWLGFRGGKGVATFLGAVLALAWPLGLAACASWLACAALSRISSVGALGAAVLVPIWAIWLAPEAIAVCVAFGLLIWWFHRTNIARILRGEEPRIGRKAA